MRIEHGDVVLEFEDVWSDGALVFEYHKVDGKWYILPLGFTAWFDYYDGHFYRSEEVRGDE